MGGSAFLLCKPRARELKCRCKTWAGISENRQDASDWILLSSVELRTPDFCVSPKPSWCREYHSPELSSSSAPSPNLVVAWWGKPGRRPSQRGTGWCWQVCGPPGTAQLAFEPDSWVPLCQNKQKEKPLWLAFPLYHYNLSVLPEEK